MKWMKTKFPGIRYREHLTRRHGVQKDKYFAIRWKVNGKDKEEGLGWLSCGWTEQKANETLAEIKRNIRDGKGPQSLAEKRAISEREREAESARQKAEAEAKRKEALRNKSFIEHWNGYFQADTNKKKCTWKTEDGLCRKWLLPAIGKLPLHKISDVHIQAIKRTMKTAGKSERTIEYTLVIVRQVFRFAIKNKTYSGDIPSIRKRKTGGLLPDFDNKKQRYLTRAEADSLIEELARHSKDVHDMTLLSLYAGLRAGEIFSLTWGCVDIDRGRLVLLDTKNGTTRTAFLNDTVKAMFTCRNRGKHDDLVFPNSRGGKITQISDTFNIAVEKLGLNNNVSDRRLKVTFHTCRHTAASWMVDNGTPLYFVKEILGHKHISTTERYSHNAESSLEAAIKALDTTTTTATETEIIART
jgi:integrase